MKRITKKYSKTKKHLNLKKKSIKNKYNKTKKKRGGGEKERKQTIIRDDFRNMFIKAFPKLQIAIKSGDARLLNNAIEFFNNGFRSNQTGINTLIPVTTNTIIISKYNRPASAPIYFIPPLVVVFENIADQNIRKLFIQNFIKYKGNINLKSYTNNITALSSAIKLKDKDLVKFLIENGADIRILTNEQQDAFNDLIKEEIIEPIQLKPVVKLDLTTELPSEKGYTVDTEPDFWKHIFEENQLLQIREKIHNMMISDGNIPIINKEITDLWSVCKINQAMIPTYFANTKNEHYEVFGTLYSDQDVDFSHYNIILCAALIIYGIISYKMIDQDYRLIFKGGKAIQLVLSGMSNMSMYKSEDIDVLLLPNKDVLYEETLVKNLSGHIAYLVKWFLDIPTMQISVLVPNPQNILSNPYIYKLSYVKVNKKYDYRKNTMIDDFRQFSDIDFNKLPEKIKDFFEKSIEYPFYISELDTRVLFVCPNIGSMLDEKIYYYAKYTQFKQLLESGKKITENGYEKTTIFDCQRFLDKFKRAILALNNGLQKQRFPDSSELLVKEKNSISLRLTKLGITNENIINEIINSLYSNGQSKP